MDLALNLFGAAIFAAMLTIPLPDGAGPTFAAKSVLAVVCFVFLLGAFDQFIHLLKWRPSASKPGDVGVS